MEGPASTRVGVADRGVKEDVSAGGRGAGLGVGGCCEALSVRGGSYEINFDVLLLGLEALRACHRQFAPLAAWREKRRTC